MRICFRFFFEQAGGMALAWGTTIGAFLQWIIQLGTARVLRTGGMLKARLQKLPWKVEGVPQLFSVLIPSTLASGMLQVATYTDMYFASFLPSDAAALGYANLLVQAPLGVLSSAVLVPILPAFAALARVEKWKELASQIRKGVLLSVGITLPVMATMVRLQESGC